MEKYIKPAMEVVEIEIEQSILNGSDSVMNFIPGLPGDPNDNVDYSDM